MRKDARFSALLFAFILLSAFQAGCGSADDNFGDDTTECERKGAWSVADDFVLGAGTTAAGEAHGAAVGPEGEIYVVGAADDGSASHWVVRKSADEGKTWETVDDFQLGTTETSRAIAVAVDLSGVVYVAGDASASSQIHWVVRKSEDGGTTWETVDQFQLSSGLASLPHGVTTDAAGNVYAIGGAQDSGGVSTWIARKSSNGGTTWTNVDAFQLGSGQSAAADSISIDEAGHIYVAGAASDGTLQHWFVRRSSDSGSSWETVDDFQHGGRTSSAESVSAKGDGELVVFGEVRQTAGAQESWMLRYSDDHGDSWSQVDLYQYASDQGSEAIAVLFEPSGVMTAVGEGVPESVDGTRWLARTASSVTGNWSVSDDYQDEAGQETQAQGLVADAKGNLFVVGEASNRWVVRVQRCS